MVYLQHYEKFDKLFKATIHRTVGDAADLKINFQTPNLMLL